LVSFRVPAHAKAAGAAIETSCSCHILMGSHLNPREAEKKGPGPQTVSGKALDTQWRCAATIVAYAESVAYIKRLVPATPRRRRWRKALRLNEISS